MIYYKNDLILYKLFESGNSEVFSEKFLELLKNGTIKQRINGSNDKEPNNNTNNAPSKEDMEDVDDTNIAWEKLIDAGAINLN